VSIELTAAVLLIAVPIAFNLAFTIVPVAYIGWSVWLIALGIGLIV
jgi:hypothetical protein